MDPFIPIVARLAIPGCMEVVMKILKRSGLVLSMLGLSLVGQAILKARANRNGHATDEAESHKIERAGRRRKTGTGRSRKGNPAKRMSRKVRTTGERRRTRS
jgi:hypothetical protein